MTEKKNIGVIGCSTIAKNSTITAILNCNNAKLEHIGSRSKNKAFEFSKIFTLCSRLLIILLQDSTTGSWN